MEVKKISEIEKEIKELNIPVKEKVTKAVIAFLISLAIVIGPIVFCINMLIYERYRGVLSLGILFCVIVFMILVQKMYYSSVVGDKVKDTNKLIILPTVIVMTLGLAFIYALFFFKVI